MALLEQQEIFETAPPRTMVLPHALGFDRAGWYGVDVSTARFNVGWIGADQRRGVHSVRLGAPNDNEGQRLTTMATQLRLLLNTMWDEGIPPPAVAFIEQAAALGGRGGSKPILWYTIGVATQVLYQATHERFGWVPRVETVPSASWKLKAVGRGNIKKPKRGKGEPPRPLADYPVWRWARTLGLPGDATWDDADAYGIAEAARRTIAIRR